MAKRKIEFSCLWRNIVQKGHEYCQLLSDDESYSLEGTAVFLHDSKACQLNYQINCDHLWQTRDAHIDGWVGLERISLHTRTDAEHRWWVNDKQVTKVSGCIDIDLNFSPCTNLIPIRRLRMQVGEKANLTAAWLRFPSFKLEPLPQQYERLDGLRYRYSSDHGMFVADLQTNELGFVLEYLPFWTSEHEN